MTRDTYIKDDWDDNALTGRSNPETGAFLHPSGDTEAGDCLVGMYRPEWDVQIESQTIDTSNGDVRVDLSGGTSPEVNAQITTRSEFGMGSVQLDFQYLTLGSDADSLEVMILSNDGGSSTSRVGVVCYSLVIGDAAANTFRLEYQDGSGATTIIDATWAGDTSTHAAEITRDPYSNFEIFADGASKGTGTDTSITDFSHAHLAWYNSAGGSHIRADNLQVR